MSAISDVLLWAMRVNGRKDAKPHQVLDIKPDASIEDAQNAFHKIARLAHPDLHRTTLEPNDLEAVTSAYSRAAAAYQEFRTTRMQPSRGKPLTTPPPSRSPSSRPATTPSAGSPTVAQNAASQMSSKALIYYRKAELALRRGDLKGAILQLKMAIAADPQSPFLRSALSEVEAEVAKAT